MALWKQLSGNLLLQICFEFEAPFFMQPFHNYHTIHTSKNRALLLLQSSTRLNNQLFELTECSLYSLLNVRN